ncbi:DUF6058 family natural product biosynthesis protein [Undibacterium curvum]|uniref:DUF6058 family natural product biosynthesis protein n=1 Tax=Undibacterium curvum TaxID=2762294 RepID=UPI003D0FA12E
MTQLDDYLQRYFLPTSAYAAHCGIDQTMLRTLLAEGLIPAPSYIVDSTGRVHSKIFGSMEAAGSKAGEFFRPEYQGWVKFVLNTGAGLSGHLQQAQIKAAFFQQLNTELKHLHLMLWRLSDCFDVQDQRIENGMQQRCSQIWNAFQNGTYGICVACPDSIAQLALKEVLQEKLNSLIRDTAWDQLTHQQLSTLLATMERYEQVTMPFSPLDYPLSSRYHLVDALKPQVTERLTQTAHAD